MLVQSLSTASLSETRPLLTIFLFVEESLDLWKVHETKNCVHYGSIEIKSVALAQATCTIYSVLQAFVHCFEKN